MLSPCPGERLSLFVLTELNFFELEAAVGVTRSKAKRDLGTPLKGLSGSLGLRVCCGGV